MSLRAVGRALLRGLAGTGLLALAACGRPAAASAYGALPLAIYASADPAVVRFVVDEYRDRTGTRIFVLQEGEGELLERLRVESGRPRADLAWGGVASLAAAAGLAGPEPGIAAPAGPAALVLRSPNAGAGRAFLAFLGSREVRAAVAARFPGRGTSGPAE